MNQRVPSHNAHIAVVDDEAEIREMLQEYLELHGFRVSVADGGAALRELVAREVPDLVVLDENLFEVPEDQISDASVLATYLAGEIVFENDKDE